TDVLDAAWSIADSTGRAQIPATLSPAIATVFGALAGVRTQSLRQWVEFVHACCRETRALNRAVTQLEVQAIASSQLPRLGLFPDATLFSGAAVTRRVERNLNVSQLLTPQGREMRDEDLIERIDAFSTSVPGWDLEELQREFHLVQENGGPSVD